jgi:hypothetical protein
MSAVFLAVRADGEYRQQVAIKLVLPGLEKDEILSRFRKERQTLAGLDHPNIVNCWTAAARWKDCPIW